MERVIQAKRLSRKEFTLEKERLVVNYRTIFYQCTEADIPLEDIYINRIVRQSKVEIFFVLSSILVGFYFFALLISKLTIPSTVAGWDIVIGLGIGTLVSLGMFFLTKKDEIVIPTETYSVTLNQKIPSKQHVDEFVSILKDRVKTYTRNKYLILNKDLDNDTRERHLFWMFERGFISQSEFESVKTTFYDKR